MRNPENVLISLTKHSNQKDYKYERLYRLLYNEELYLTAYQNIYSNDGSMTKGTDKQTVDGMSIERIRKIIVSLKDESYQPKPARRTYIPKKNGKMRPLGIPSFEDKLLQEVIRMILEAIYEGHFENTSHGFRPNRSCHTALNEIQKTFTGVKWFIEGDIKGFFDNINHATLIGILRERINDERFLRLVRKFLNAGYIENWTFHNTYSGTPQGGIISPILANIYLDKFDKYVNEYVRKFKKGKKRMRTKEYRRNEVELSKARIALKNANDDCERENAIARIRQLEKERVNIPPSDPMDNNYAMSITPDVVKAFHNQDVHSTPESKNAYGSKLRQLLRYMAGQDLVLPTLVFAVSAGCAPRRSIVDVLSDDMVKKIYEYREKASTPIELRDTAMVMLGLRMGIRGADILKLQVNDFDWKNKTVSFIQQKTRKAITLPVPTDVGNSVYKYIMDGRPESAAAGNGYIFIRHQAPYIPLKVTTACRGALKRILAEYGFELSAGQGFHMTRKTFATRMLRAGNRLDDISNALGHACQETAEVYLERDEDKMRLCPLEFGGVLS